MNRIVLGDNLGVLQGMETGSIELIYVDPPFNTGKRQSRTQMKTVRDEAGDRVGFGGRRYRTEIVANTMKMLDRKGDEGSGGGSYSGGGYTGARKTGTSSAPAPEVMDEDEEVPF